MSDLSQNKSLTQTLNNNLFIIPRNFRFPQAKLPISLFKKQILVDNVKTKNKFILHQYKSRRVLDFLSKKKLKHRKLKKSSEKMRAPDYFEFIKDLNNIYSYRTRSHGVIYYNASEYMLSFLLRSLKLSHQQSSEAFLTGRLCKLSEALMKFSELKALNMAFNSTQLSDTGLIQLTEDLKKLPQLNFLAIRFKE